MAGHSWAATAKATDRTGSNVAGGRESIARGSRLVARLFAVETVDFLVIFCHRTYTAASSSGSCRTALSPSITTPAPDGIYASTV
jgi:hypothetical protein